MIQVHLNGVALLPGVDYSQGRSTITFSMPPHPGDDIMITQVLCADTGATQVTSLVGDGKTYLFRFDPSVAARFKLQDMIESAWRHQDNPAVQDALEKLRVVLELVKE